MKDKVILITGGTGSLGKSLVAHLLPLSPKKIIIFSRDELKQYEMQKTYNSACMRYFLGDVRDPIRLIQAFKDVDYVIHAAALKQVPAAEYNPEEFIKTNINGAMNVINAAINCNVKKVIALSTDKACNPINLYGATKLTSDKLFVSANSLAGAQDTLFSVVRYGNVIESRGSVIPLFKSQSTITLTDDRMTRFVLTLNKAAKFVVSSLDQMRGCEIFVPKIPSIKIMDLAQCFAKPIKVVGIRPGEKLHECMISEDETTPVYDMLDRYIISDNVQGDYIRFNGHYSSDTNDIWLTKDQLFEVIDGRYRD